MQRADELVPAVPVATNSGVQGTHTQLAAAAGMSARAPVCV